MAGAWADERSKLLLVLDAVGLFCLSTSAGALTWFGLQTGHTDFGIGGLVEGVILLSLGYFAFRSSHALWKRFDFDSLVIWVEMEGSYVSANIEHGNIMHDTIKTKSNVVQIQSMTFRLWIARVSSVTFGVKTQRYVVNMAGEPDYAAALAGQLRNFARSRAMILAPTSQSDIENHVALDHLNRLSRPLQEGSKDNAVALPVESGFGENALLPLDNAGLDAPCKTLAARYCSQCGSGVALADLFCQSCGNHLKPV